MKNLALLLLFISTICSAQVELEGNKEGAYRVKEDAQEWAPSGVTAEPETIKYIDSFSQVISNPDNPLLVKQSEKILKLKPAFKKLVEVEKNFIVYNGSTATISYLESKEVKEETSYLILFSIASILLMIISNILFKKYRNIFTALFAILAFVAAFVVFAVLVVFPTVAIVAAAAFAVLVAAFTAAAAFIAVTIVNKKYKLISIIFYSLMAIHIVLLFV